MMEMVGIQGFRLSPEQQRRVAIGQGADRGRVRIRIRGPLSASSLRAAIESVVARHEILRTTFPGARLQVVGDAAVVEWIEGVSRPSEVDLAHGPLLRCVLGQRGEEASLTLELPALCADAHSLAQIAREIAHAYAGGPAGAEPRQFADIAEWQHDVFDSGDAAVALGHWRRIATQAMTSIHLPGASATLAGTASPAGIVRDLPAAAAEKTPAFLQAALHAVLFRVTGSSPTVVGRIFDGRTYDELQDVVGPLAHVVPVQVEPEEALSFRSLVAAVEAEDAHAREFQDCFRWDSLAPSQAAEPIYAPVCFGFIEPGRQLAAGAATFTVEEITADADRFRAAFLIEDGAGSPRLRLRYDTAVLDAAAAEALAAEYATLLGDALERPDAPVGDLRILNEQDERRLTAHAGLAVPAAEPFHEAFERQAARDGARVALRLGAEEVTYHELNRRANRVAHGLRGRGVGTDDLVAIAASRSAEMVAFVLGVLKSGAAYLPIDPSYPPVRIDVITAEARPKAWLRDGDSASFDDLPDTNPALPTTAESLAYVIYTSGSTGRPKGVMVTHGGLANYVLWSATAYDVASGRGSVVHSPLSFDLTVTSLLTPLAAGQTVILVPGEGVGALAEALRCNRDLSLVKITPSHLDALSAEFARGEAVDVRVFVIGGEALTGATLARWRPHAPRARFVNEYGPTETVVGCCVYEVGPGEASVREPVPIGRAVAGAELYVLDGRGRPVPAGVPGELYIGGPGVARGYLHRPELTADRFVAHPFSAEPGRRLYRTGDRVRAGTGGELEFLGRLDEQVKLRGYRIELGEIEAVIRQHPEVREVAVALREVAGDKRLAAFVVAGTGADARRVQAFARERLPEYMVPASWTLVRELPLLSNGKLDRKAVARLKAAPTPSSHCPPRTLIETTLARIWKEVLGAERIGVHDNFFELGGHSLTATQVVSRIRDTFDADLPLGSIFESPTVAELAVAIVRCRVQQTGSDALVEEVERLSEDEVSQALAGTHPASPGQDGVPGAAAQSSSRPRSTGV